MKRLGGITTLVTDADNTLYSWIDYIVPCLEAMVETLHRQTGLARNDIVSSIKKVFERIKPLFVEHGGDFQFQGIDDGVVKVKLIGQCQLCVYKEKTQRALEAMLKNEVDGVKSVEVV